MVSVIYNILRLPSAIYIITTLGTLMKDASYLLKLARRCRDLEKTAIASEVIEQLRIWTTELAEMAECSEPRAAQPEMAE